MTEPIVGRREFMKLAGATALAGSTSSAAPAPSPAVPAEKADYSLRIAPARIDLGGGHFVATTAYNGQVPGPLVLFQVPATA